MIHTPVLLEESKDYLIREGEGVYFDATAGFGGHMEAFLSLMRKRARLIGVDKDISAFNHTTEKFSGDGRVIVYNTTFTDIDKVAKLESVDAFDGIFADLGVSSFQLDESSEGFTFRQNAPLDLRMDKSSRLTAADVVNKFDEKEIADIIYKYGEEKKSRQIARQIVLARKNGKISETGQLKKIIEELVPVNFLNKTLSRVFQALRIYVNNELEELEDFLKKSVTLLKPGGRIVILSYHSLEDRIVKDVFKYESSECVCPPGLPVCTCGKVKTVNILTRKPVVPTDEEQKLNPRSRSAKLRAAEKI